MNRRDLITLLGGAAMSPLTARAQQPVRQHIMRFLSFLIVLFSLAEATPPALALSIPALTLDVRSTDAAGAFILVRKGKGHKGHGDGDERFERHHRHHPDGTSG